ncbi:MULTISPECIES: chromate transporter [Helcococcus]|uniref:Chromate transporter n=1 Tax=Helcococcus bovis TaxID=3153252 RepID=A0ABW9F8U5_9FIRM
MSEKKLVELIALTGVLPGLSSSQTIVSIGYKIGGPLLAFLTMLVWAIPAIIFMTILSFIIKNFGSFSLSKNIFRFIGPMAIALILKSGYDIGKKVICDKITILLFIFGLLTAYFIRNVWIFPVVLIIGEIVTVLI